MKWMIDIDDVLAELAEEWIALYNKDHNDTLQKSDIHDWRIGDYTKIGNAMYDYLDLPDLYDHVEVVPNALEGINLIRSKTPNPQIIYVTHVSPGHAGQKYNWLLRNGFLQEYDQYFEGYSKHSIAKYLFDADVMIDDNPTHITQFQGKVSVLFNQPWNESLQKTHKPVLRNWNDFIDRVNKLGYGIEE